VSLILEGYGDSNLIITDGFGEGVGAGILPTFTPSLERAALPGGPELVKAHTPTSVYRVLQLIIRGLVYGY